MQHYLTNWQNGMKVSQKHFSDSESALREELYLSLAARVTSYNYGLLPQNQGAEGIDLWCKLENTGTYRIGLSKCLAITRGGYRVEINDYASHLSLSQPEAQVRSQMEQAGGKLLVILTVLPFEHEAFGEPDPEESPLRLPWVRPTYRLELMRQDQTHLMPYQLPVGRLIGTAQGVGVDATYYPPCCAITSLSSLRERFARWRRALDYVMDGCMQTILRVDQLSTPSVQPTRDEIVFRDPGSRPISPGNAETAIDVKWIARKLSGQLLESIAEIKPLADNILLEQPPVYSLYAYQQIAAKAFAGLRALSSVERAHWVNFIKELHQLENPTATLQELTQYAYNHTQAQEACDIIEKFLRMLLAMYDHYNGLPVSTFAWQRADIRIEEVPPTPQRQDIL